jgi:hypothetical protein
VPEEEIVKGYEHAKGHHVLIKQDELDELKLEASHTIDMTTFVDRDETAGLKTGHQRPRQHRSVRRARRRCEQRTNDGGSHLRGEPPTKTGRLPVIMLD